MTYCLNFISHSKAIELLNPSEKEILEQHKTTVQYKKSEVILKQGTIIHNILYVISGLVKIKIEGLHKEIILAIKKDNNYLGLSSIYNINEDYLYSVVAIEDCVIDSYEIDAFEQVMKSNSAFANKIIKYINHNSARIFNRFLCLTEKNSRGKIAEMILYFSNFVYENTQFTIPMSRKELSEFVGLSMENTIRILKEFESDGIISLKGKDFDIIDKDRLERISDFG